MTLPAFELMAPRTLKEAGAMIARLGPRGRLLAGGTDLFIDIQDQHPPFRAAVDLMSVRGLDVIDVHKRSLRIGATATMTDVARSADVQRLLPALSEAAASMGSEQIRNSATIGGNVANAVPSADTPPSLVVAGAHVELYQRGRRRRVKVDGFFTGPRKTVLRRGEILVRIVVPPLGPRTGVAYEKFVKRGANVVAVASCAALVSLKRGKIDKVRIALGAVAPTPVRATGAEAMLTGEKPGDELFAAAGRAAVAAARPITDVRASREYRRELVEVLTRRALAGALARARGGKAKGGGR
jgi:carbon-monoxide dehydrogenase medium subunit